MSQEDRQVLGWGAFVVAVAALFVAAFAVLRDDGGSAATESTGPEATPTIVEVRLTEFALNPAALTVPPGPLTIRVVNAGSATHNYVINGLNARTPDLQPGESYTMELGTLSPGTYDTLCDIPGHAAAGMIGTLSVREGAAAPGESTAAGGHGGESWQDIDERMEIRNASFPAATEQHGGQPFEPEILPDGTKLFRITTSYVDWEVEPGKFVKAMAHDGKSFPATQPYTMAVGEVLMVHYQNEGLMGHPMHLHQPVGWIVAKDGVPLDVPIPGDTIWVSPGERYTVLYRAELPGVWAWHCHILTHAEGPQGFWGMVTALIVTP